jgi:hypothetical protein
MVIGSFQIGEFPLQPVKREICAADPIDNEEGLKIDAEVSSEFIPARRRAANVYS